MFLVLISPLFFSSLLIFWTYDAHLEVIGKSLLAIDVTRTLPIIHEQVEWYDDFRMELGLLFELLLINTLSREIRFKLELKKR